LTIYLSHCGLVHNDPQILAVKAVRGGEMISDAWNGTGNKFQAKPSILFFVVPTKDSELYRRIKKSCECRYGVVSQVLQSAHVQKAQDQYISNVCMKVNAKLGGSTCFANGGLSRLNPNFGKVPTMIIGADVSHAAPGDDSSGSMAAFTMSLDKQFTRYAAKCETNGQRVEIITTHNINTALKDMVQMWSKMYGGNTPHQVLYFRDGVSESQYQFVLNQEVADMRAMFASINPKVTPKFTVVICAKRHHIRFFPGRAGDRNENPVPGTLVETGATHPFEFDYYLCSHSAIKGTARPVHYHVIANENGYENVFIEQLTFEHCMQYARSTTPVSMIPPVYYAHLASNRAVAHKNEPTVSSGKKEQTERGKKGNQTLSSSDIATEIPPLMPLNNQNGILGSMWFI
jgi:eukaryotic translation initiation factor 2C